MGGGLSLGTEMGGGMGGLSVGQRWGGGLSLWDRDGGGG